MPEDTTTLRFSIFFHDIIYQPDRKDNEEKSAEKWVHFINRAEKILQRDLTELKNNVHDAILSTKHHQVDINKPLFMKVLSDIDMAVLSSKS